MDLSGTLESERQMKRLHSFSYSSALQGSSFHCKFSLFDSYTSLLQRFWSLLPAPVFSIENISLGSCRHPSIKKESNIFMDFAAFGLFCQVCLKLKWVRMLLIISVTLFGTIYWRISYSKLAHLSFYIYILGNSVRWKDQSFSKCWIVTVQRQ